MIKNVKFDGTINLGHVLTILSIVSGGFMVYTSVQSTLDQHEIRIDTLEDHQRSSIETNLRIYQRLNEVAEDIATTRGRLEGYSPKTEPRHAP